ncbi:hypothetical protein LCGC14_1141560, partial [marine sediment metagenome]
KAQARENRLTKASSWKDQLKERITKPADPQLSISGGNDGASLSNPNITGGPDSMLFASFGEQLMAIRDAGLGTGVDPRLAAITGSGETLPSDGGFLVQQDFSSEILKRSYEFGAITSRVRQIPLSAGKEGTKINAIAETSRATGSRWGGVQVYRVAEGEQYTHSKPKMRQIVLSLKKLIGLWYATDELLSDARAMETVASQAFSEELTFVIENEIIRGTGAGQMQGILNAGCLVTVTKETDQAGTTLVKENIDKMWSRCWGRSRLNSVWFYNQDIEPQLNNMTIDIGTGGQAVYLPPGGINNAPYGSLYGRPTIPVEYCATLGAVGDIILADFSQYLTIDSGGVDTATSIHLRFDYGEQVFRWTLRNDGQCSWAAPLTPFQGTKTLSPFVVCAAR